MVAPVKFPEWVGNFLGVNKTTPESRVPANESPDSNNADFRNGQVMPRPGFVKWAEIAAYRKDGLLLEQPGALPSFGNVASIADIAMPASWRIEFVYYWVDLRPAASADWVANTFIIFGSELSFVVHVEGDIGLKVAWGAYEIVFTTSEVQPERPYIVELTQEGSNMVLILKDIWAGTTQEKSLAQASTTLTRVLSFGSEPAGVGPVEAKYILINEFRWWDASYDLRPRLIDDLQVLHEATWAAYLLAYTGFRSGDYVRSNGERTYATDLVCVSDSDQFPAESLSFVPDDRSPPFRDDEITLNYEHVTGLAPSIWDTDNPSLLICQQNSIFELPLSESQASPVLLAALKGNSQERWSWTGYNRKTILCNGASENLRVGSDGAAQLSLRPFMTLVVDQSSTAGTLPTGTYQYAILYYDEDDAVQSAAIYATYVNVDATKKAKLTFAHTRAQLGAPNARLYRTQVGGSVFYLLEGYDSLTMEYEDDEDDANLIVPLEDNGGWVEPSLFSLEYRGMLILCGSNYEQVTDDVGIPDPYLVFSDLYASRIRYNVPGLMGRYPASNFLNIGASDGEPLRGGVVQANTAILFKPNSIWVLTGDGPSTLGTRKLYDGIGCVSPSTVASSPSGTYFYNGHGIFFLPNPAGVPVDLTGERLRDDLTVEADDWARCTGFYDAEKRRYLLTIWQNDVPTTVVYDERNQSLSLWDFGAECWLRWFYGDSTEKFNDIPKKVYKNFVGWNAFVGEMDDAVFSDGAFVYDEGHLTAKGVVKSGVPQPHYVAVEPYPGTMTYEGSVITLLHASGVTEERTVLRQEGAILYVTEFWDIDPVEGEVVYFGRLECTWRTPYLYVDGDPGNDVAVERIRFQFEDVEPLALQTYLQPFGEEQFWFRAIDPTDKPLGFADRPVAFGGRLRRFAVGLFHKDPDTSFTLDGLQISYQNRGDRPPSGGR